MNGQRQISNGVKKYIALAIAIILLGGGAFASQQWFVQMYGAAENQTAAVKFTASADGAVLDAMNARAAEGRFSFSGRDFPGMGFFVEEINGKQNADGYYWILRINGAKSDLGVSSARIRRGDMIEWRYEKGY